MLRTHVRVCALLALGALAAGVALGRVELDAAGLGLLIGAVNGSMVLRSVRSELPMSMTSLGRLGLLSLLALGAGFLLFPTAVWAVPLGVGGAQLLLAGMAAKEAVS